MTAPTQEVDPGADATPEAAPPRQRLSREAWIMLVVPPALILLSVGGLVWWRLTADLDSIEANQLRWSLVLQLIWEHIQLTLAATVIVVVVAIPLGVGLTRDALRGATGPVMAVANAGQAAPSIGLIVLFFLWLRDTGLSGFWISVIVLSLYGILPVLRNTITGIQGIDPTLVEAGRGVGMTQFGTLFSIEIRLAVPVIMSGLRTSLVLVVGTASLACFINGGGLGEIVQTGITLYRYSLMISGALLIAALALFIEWVGRLLELLVRPKGV